MILKTNYKAIPQLKINTSKNIFYAIYPLLPFDRFISRPTILPTIIKRYNTQSIATKHANGTNNNIAIPMKTKPTILLLFITPYADTADRHAIDRWAEETLGWAY